MFPNPYFKESELACRCCGKLHFNEQTLSRLIRVRARFAKPVVISSGYRCEAYNKHIGATQTHATGQAVDVRVASGRAHDLLRIALDEGFTGIGVKQKGDFSGRFIHLDDLESIAGERTRPTVWSY